MVKPTTSPNPNVLNLICIFNSFSKCIGFSVLNPNDSFFSKSIRELVFFWLSLFAFFCTIRSELWCLKFLNIGFDIKKIIVFVTNQMIILSPIGCLLYFRLCDLSVWKIIMKVQNLEKNLIFCDKHMLLEIKRIRYVGSLYWFCQFFIVLSMMYYTLWPMLVFFLLDSVCIFYFEAWVAIPFLQFVGWIWFLSYVSYCMYRKIIDINELEYVTKTDFRIKIKCRLARVSWNGCGLDKLKQMKKIINILKQVLNIAKELSAAYGISVLIYIVHYLSRVIIQFYDIIDKDARKFPMWASAWNVIVRIMFILPVFVCCEYLSYSINKTVDVIQEIVTLHQPSCLDCIFQSLALRLQHQSTTTQICGFLNITYRSFLTIMTTALAFLLLQLQF